ncbi:MAG: L,D-transpeptidase [Burkholderiales bacterium]
MITAPVGLNRWRKICIGLWACWFFIASASAEDGTAVGWRERFAQEVDRRLEVPPLAQQQYMDLLDAALADAGLLDLPPQALLLVDRSVQVQAAFLLLRTAQSAWVWLGAVPVSTGRVGSFDHFVTPLGVFAHTLDNPDFRAEGSYNEHHIRGYGVRGMRVFDFGWALAERGWGPGGSSLMRLQMHATDPKLLEPRLGRAESKGCIRIPATFNVFMDRHGVLDADYEQALASGRSMWVLRADRQPLPWPGRYLVIVDSNTLVRPDWSPLPGAKPPVARDLAGTGPGPKVDMAASVC